MAKTGCRWKCPEQWSEWSEWLAAGLHARNRWRLPVLLVGILFAQGRRTVTSWLRAAGVSDDFQDYYYFLAPLGRKTKSVATQLFALVLREQRVLSATCGMKGHSFISLALYAFLAGAATIQLARTAAHGSALQSPLHSDMLRRQHLSVVVVCVVRSIPIMFSNAFYDSPGIIVLFFQIGTFLVVATFGSQVKSGVRP